MRAHLFVCSLLGMCLSVPTAMFAQPDSLWSRAFGGSSGDACYSVRQTSDGGYILAGTTQSFGAGGIDFWLVKTDENGIGLWSRTFGGVTFEYCYAVRQASDAGYILVGSTASFGAGNFDFYVVKTDANGDTLWTRTFGGTSTEVCRSIEQTSDGGYILGGNTYSYGVGYDDFWLWKIDANGNPLWSRTYGGPYNEVCYSVARTSDGGYIAGGHTNSFGAGSNDVWVVKISAGGDSLWSQTYGGNDYEYCYIIRQTSDGGYIVGGSTGSFGAGGHDIWLIKTDPNGNALWTRTFGGSEHDRCLSIEQVSDGGYILAGNTASFGAGSGDFWLLRVGINGDSLWSRTFGGSNGEECHDFQVTSDGGCILAGHTWSFGAGSDDFWLVRTGPDPLSAEPYITLVPNEHVLHQNYPNPFNATTRIAYDLPKSSHVTLKVLDLVGREVITLASEMQSAGNHSATFDGSGLASGVYFYRLQAGDFIQIKKMMLLK